MSAPASRLTSPVTTKSARLGRKDLKFTHLPSHYQLGCCSLQLDALAITTSMLESQTPPRVCGCSCRLRAFLWPTVPSRTFDDQQEARLVWQSLTRGRRSPGRDFRNRGEDSRNPAASRPTFWPLPRAETHSPWGPINYEHCRNSPSWRSICSEPDFVLAGRGKRREIRPNPSILVEKTGVRARDNLPPEDSLSRSDSAVERVFEKVPCAGSAETG